jgi:PAS domain S-box-containing protein
MNQHQPAERRAGPGPVPAFVTAASGVVVMAIGLLALIGWVFKFPLLASFGADLIPMAPSMAVLFLLYGAAVCLRARRPAGRRLFQFCLALAGAGALIALLLLSLSSLNIHWEVEHMGLNIPHPAGQTPIGHISPVSALCFVLAGLSFLASLSPGGIPFWRSVLALGAAGLTLGLCFVFLLAYVFGAPLLYGGTFIPPALNTILAFTVLGLALLALARWPAGPAGGLPEDGDGTAFWFVLVFALTATGIVTTGYNHYRNYEQNFYAGTGNELSIIAGLKADQLVQYRKERLGDANTFYNNSAFSEYVRAFLGQPADADVRRQLQAWLGVFQNYYEYTRISLFDARGAERLAIPDLPEPLPGQMAGNIAGVLKSRQVTFLDFYRDAPGLPVQLAMLVPIYDESDTNRPLGVLVFRIDPQTRLYPFLKFWPSSSRTAETLLVRREGNEVVFLNDLRFQTNAALNRRIPLSNTDVPAVKVALGQTGVVTGMDYRGEPVIAAVRPVPGTPWFLVAREDVAEALAPAREELWQVTSMIGLLIFSWGAGVLLVWRQQHIRLLRTKLEAGAERARLGAIVESSHDAIIGENLDGIITSWNVGAEKIYGYTAAEAVGKPVAMLIPPGLQDQFPQLMERVKRGEAVVNLEAERIRKDGEHIHVSLTLSVVRDAAGKIVGASAIGCDITERKRAEEAIRSSREEFKDLFDNAPVGFHEVDAEGRVVRMNNAELRMLGYTAEELLGQFVWKISADEELSRNAALAKLAGAHMPPSEGFEQMFRRKDGSTIPVWISDRILKRQDGVITGIRAAIQDITERRVAEAQLQRVLADLERSNKDLEQFAYVASHDLQEPLRMVSSYTQLLAKRFEGQLDEKTQKYVHYAVDGAVRMQTLINDLLAYSRVGTRGHPLEPADSHAVLGEAVKNLAATIAETRAVITNGNLPVVRADASQLVLVFQNLLSNAIKFRRGDMPCIHVSAQERGGEWVFAVKDNGIGIEPRHAERVFVIFQRLHTREEYPGTGIGLAVCKRIVERHGGKIRLESEPGNGTTFFFTVPKQGNQ